MRNMYNIANYDCWFCKNLARGRATEAGETNPESESDSVEFEALLYGKGETE